jgi:DNA polymerase III alpha subunit
LNYQFIYNFFYIRSQEEKKKWLQDLCEALEKVKNLNEEKSNYLSLKSNSKLPNFNNQNK